MNFRLFFLPVYCIIILYSCSGRRENYNEEVIANYKNGIVRAERFTIDKKDSLTEVTIINPWQGAVNVNQKYYLVNQGEKIPDGIDTSCVIFVPLKRIICMATSHVAMISALGEENSVCGISGCNLVYDSKIEKLISEGKVAEVGYDSNLNKELILKLAPDIIMMYGIGSESEGVVAKLQEMGLKVIFNADYLETDPLGRAEWIKLFGALFAKSKIADSIYSSELTEYTRLKSIISNESGTKPKVMMGLPFRDTWYISPGNSYMSKLIGDAGGAYLWADKQSSVSMPIGLENVYFRAIYADFWINTGTAKSKNEISVADQRLSDLPCFKNGNLYNNNKSVWESGANDYWERGMLYPHLILKDLATIFHPGIFGKDELEFYIKIK